MTHKDINYKVRGDEAKDSDKKMSWRYVQLIFYTPSFTPYTLQSSTQTIVKNR
mgnify:CR=1 FL=1